MNDLLKDDALSPSGHVMYPSVTLDRLIAELQSLKQSGVPGTARIVLAKDGEGNGFSPMSPRDGVDASLYDAETTWSGERYMTDAAREATGKPEEYAEAPESAVVAVFLWPTN